MVQRHRRIDPLIRWIDKEAIFAGCCIPDVDACLLLTFEPAAIEAEVAEPRRLLHGLYVKQIAHTNAQPVCTVHCREVLIEVLLLLSDPMPGCWRLSIF